MKLFSLSSFLIGFAREKRLSSLGVSRQFPISSYSTSASTQEGRDRSRIKGKKHEEIILHHHSPFFFPQRRFQHLVRCSGAIT